MRTRLSTQRGYLAMVAVLLILVIGFLGTTLTYTFVGGANATLNYQQAESALNIAEAGLEKSTRFLLTPTLTGSNARIGCANITSNSNLTNTSFGAGTFTATTVASNPVYTSTTLSSAITNSVTTIPVASTAGFAPAGRIMIDDEILNYGGISGNSFIGVQRGVNYSYSTPHASSAPVAQYQCMVNVVGGIPSATSPAYKREIQQAVQLQEAWAAGVTTNSNFTFTRWNQPTEITWSTSLFASSAKANLNGISMTSNADGWAVGDVVGSNFTLLRWNGTTWVATTLAVACSNQDLTSVSTVYSNEAWAVGPTYRTDGTCTNASGNQRFTILKWNGSSWSKLSNVTSPSIPADSSSNTDLNAVHVIDTTQSGAGNFGFAVGVDGMILKYNGSTWTSIASPTTHDLFGVYVVSATEAWAVGASGDIIKWNGSSWSLVTSPTNTRLNAIYMLDTTQNGSANTGWAVGNSGVALVYNGSTWSAQNAGGGDNLFGVAMFTSNDVWAAGAGGTIKHWDGSAWSDITSGTNKRLNGISVIAPQQYPFAWQEIFP